MCWRRRLPDIRLIHHAWPSKAVEGDAAEQLVNQIYCDTGTLMHDMIVTYDGTNVTYYLDGTLRQVITGLQNSFADSRLNLSGIDLHRHRGRFALRR